MNNLLWKIGNAVFIAALIGLFGCFLYLLGYPGSDLSMVHDIFRILALVGVLLMLRSFRSKKERKSSGFPEAN